MLSDNYILRFVVIYFSIYLFSCQSENKNLENPDINRYGGHIQINEKENFVSLNPHAIDDAHSLHIINQLYEGLVKFTPKGDTLELCLAKSLRVNPEKTQYRFVLKDSIYFHDNICFKNSKGQKLNAKDVEFTFKQIFNEDPENFARNYFIDVIKGAQEFHRSRKYLDPSSNIEGVKVINSQTIEFILNRPDPVFLNKLASVYGFIFSETAYKFYGRRLSNHPVGTGPFLLQNPSDLVEDQQILLHRHPLYHTFKDGNRLPYLDMVTFFFLKESELEHENFMNGAIDVIHNQKKDIYNKIEVEKNPDYDDFRLIVSKDLSSYFLGFNTKKESFNELDIRKTLARALPRKTIYNTVYPKPFYEDAYFINNELVSNFLVEDTLKIKSGVSKLKTNTQNDTKINNISGNILYINSLGEINSSISEGIKRNFKKNLDINLAINPIPLSYHKQKVIRKEEPIFFTEINYLYPDPDFILRKFVSDKRLINVSSYSNAEYDRIYNDFVRENRDINALEASNLLMSELPMIPLFDVTNIIIYKPHLKNFVWNKINYLDLRNVYTQEPRKMNPL